MQQSILEACISRNLSTRKITKELDCSQSTVKYWLQKYNLKTKPIIKQRSYKCNKCNNKGIDNFYPNIRGLCIKCHNIRRSILNRSNKEKAIAIKGGKCEKCGYCASNSALEFHHKNPKEKDPNYRLFKNRNFNIYKKEIEKCILVCANCHREIHDQLRLKPL